MWWECSECGGRIEGARPERICAECGTLGGVYVPVHSFAGHAPEESGFREAWFDRGVDKNLGWLSV
ncbi:MAG: hypothetical protein H6714_09600 [Myxococcales bacterium]|nr:hypothetical protein [Myxococcales bacterium]